MCTYQGREQLQCSNPWTYIQVCQPTWSCNYTGPTHASNLLDSAYNLLIGV